MNVDELSRHTCALGRRDRLLLIALIRENPELGVVESEALEDYDRATRGNNSRKVQ